MRSALHNKWPAIKAYLPEMITNYVPLSSQDLSSLAHRNGGAYWTGDNSSNDDEVKGAVQMILANGIGGNVFGGPDIPANLGEPSEEMWVRMY